MSDRAPSNGVAEHIDFEDTGELVAGIATAAGTEAHIERLIEALSGRMGSGTPPAPGGVPPEKHAKSIKRHNWATVIGVVVTLIGGMTANYYATEARSRENAERVEAVEIDLDGTERRPGLTERVADTEDNIRVIRDRVGKIDEHVEAIETSQSDIAHGIEELKAENVKRLEDELAEARRELRRANRDR